MPRGKAGSTLLERSPFYDEIITRFDAIRRANGKVCINDYYRREIEPRVPGFTLGQFYQFLDRRKKRANSRKGKPSLKATLSAVYKAERDSPMLRDSKKSIVQLGSDTVFSQTDMAIRKALAMLLQIGENTLTKLIAEDQDTGISDRDKIELMFKAVKALDDHLKTVGETWKAVKDTAEEGRAESVRQSLEAAAYSPSEKGK